MSDVLVIGGGPGGYATAIRAAQLGGKVVLVEKDELGGTCLNRGCIPTKALSKSASLLSELARAGDFGITVQNVSIDFGMTLEKTKEITKRLVKGLKFLIEANHIQTVKGTCTLVDPKTVEVLDENGGKKSFRSKNIIIATGSRPAVPQELATDRNGIITTDEFLELKEAPKDILIIGGNEIGVEFAYICKAFGANVTLVEAAPRILQSVDEEIATHLQQLMKKSGVNIITDAKISKICDSKEGSKVFLLIADKEQKEISVEKTLSVRRIPNTNLGLDGIRVAVRDGRLLVDDHMKTNVPGIYAVGDVVGGSYAHVAFEEGIVAAENAMGIDSAIDYKVVPRCIFAVTEAASVGLTEEQAKQQNYEIRVGKFPFSASGRALTLRESRGFVKTVAESKTGEILGVHIVGPRASDLIAEAALAIKLEATVEEIADTFHAHPTLSEALKESSLDVLGRALHTIK
jgi:dihydrolipoamide dehydrogenase